MLIRRAKLDEGKILSKIAMRSKAYWGYDDSFMEACREDLTLTENIIASNLVYVLENSSFIIGFFCLIVSGKSGKLDAFFIDPTFIGKGYGRKLWNYVMQKAKEAGISEFTIDVDPHAEGFYRKMGAIGIGEVDSTVLKNRKLLLMKMII